MRAAAFLSRVTVPFLAAAVEVAEVPLLLRSYHFTGAAKALRFTLYDLLPCQRLKEVTQTLLLPLCNPFSRN